MKILQRISEDEVIAEFLIAEINSKRFGALIKNAMGNEDATIVTNPNINNNQENHYRRSLLGEVRGFGKNEDLFENFPSEVSWNRAIFTKEDLQAVMYIDYSYWNQLSNNTRYPVDAAKNILNDVEIFSVSNDGFREIHSEIKRGKTFPRLIFVSCNEYSRIVVLEGHARLTAYFLDLEYVPEELEVIMGYSEEFVKWDLY